MARKPGHRNLSDLVQYSIRLYYIERTKRPGIKFDESKHLELVNKIISYYHNELTTFYPKWDIEETRGFVKGELDFLTGIFSKQKAEEEKRAKLKAFKEGMKIRK